MKESLIFSLIVVIVIMLNEVVKPSRKKRTKRLCGWHSSTQKRGIWLLDNYNCDECKHLPEPPKGAA